VAAAAGLAILLPLAAVTGYAQAARGALAGVVTDPSGARVPRCQVTAKNTEGSNQEVTYANAAGEYQFASIPPGMYALEFGAPGFAAGKSSVQVHSGGATRADYALEIGQAMETITITGGKPPTVVVAQAGPAPQKVRVGGNVQALRVAKMVHPVYPDELKQLGVQGTVVIRGVVSTTGELLHPEVINTDVDARLAKAALDAVSQWRYQPSLLNGEPVEVATTITLDFQLDQ
jgi:TonB family protein